MHNQIGVNNGDIQNEEKDGTKKKGKGKVGEGRQTQRIANTKDGKRKEWQTQRMANIGYKDDLG